MPGLCSCKFSHLFCLLIQCLEKYQTIFTTDTNPWANTAGSIVVELMKVTEHVLLVKLIVKLHIYLDF